MKKILISLLLSILLFSQKVEASPSTGHDELDQIGFYDLDNPHLLLCEYSKTSIKEYQKKVPRCAFGWSVYPLSSDEEVWYIANVIFSRSNNTSSDITIDYKTKYSKTKKIETSISGSIAPKLSGKIKGATASLEATIKGEYNKSITDFFEENTDFSVKIPKGKKVSLVVKGEGLLSSGVGKCFFLGITVAKGTYEYVNVETEYFELLEEEL